MSTLFLRASDVRALITMKETIEVVEEAFKEHARGKTQMPAKVYLNLDKGDFRAMPASLPGAAGLKWVNVHPGNPPLGLPTVMAVVIYNDPETGYPLAVMDGTDTTAYRTGATSAIAAKHLARKDAATLGLIGAGHEAHTHLLAHVELFKFKSIRVYDINESKAEKFVREFPDYPAKASSLEETVSSDIICTLTPSRQPYLKKEWVKPGAHINAVGADAPGKEELEPAVLKSARVVVDNMEQAVHGGEVNVPISRGLYLPEEIYGTLDEVVSGKKPGRANEREVTIFVSTGLAIEDVAVAKLLYEKAKKKGGYLTLDFV
ncbi:MAG: ornithine cyclodeaminase family protein [Chloroflexota bacterium]